MIIDSLNTNIAYRTEKGICIKGISEEVLTSPSFEGLHGMVDLIFTSPPFPLNRKKKYGNLLGDEYINWFSSFATIFKNLLRPSGSIVIELGNSWEKGSPVMSTLALRSLLNFLDEGNYFLCQQFIWNNPAKLPGPAQWVNIERIRVKDAFTHLWWMSKSERPKANNRNVLSEYSDSMKYLLKRKKYNHGKRPSEHHIGEESFLSNNNGAIPSNVITLANTQSSSKYLNYCKQKEIPLHPARMPLGLPEFFINFLTEENDLILDPFAGSNTTGFAAEKLNRRWVSIEPNTDYIEGSKGWFSFNIEGK
jgi:site-specific DNA-methyltransferase (cytosine-N4-specific)